MKVDFNNLRLQACKNMNALIKLLNERNDDGIIQEIELYEIEDIIDNLRDNIVHIACTYDEGNDNFADLSQKINVAHFNYAVEDE